MHLQVTHCLLRIAGCLRLKASCVNTRFRGGEAFRRNEPQVVTLGFVIEKG
jgi:hypothetical protein